MQDLKSGLIHNRCQCMWQVTSHDLCFRRGKLSNMSDDISRSIASAVSQVVQLRAVDQALTINRYWSPKAGKNASGYNTDNQTSEYLDMLLDLGYLPIITKPTRITDHSATLIDHIYTNVPQKVVKSGICFAGITDHLPIFLHCW